MTIMVAVAAVMGNAMLAALCQNLFDSVMFEQRLDSTSGENATN